MLWSSMVIAYKRVEQQDEGIGHLAFFDQNIYPNIKTSPSPESFPERHRNLSHFWQLLRYP